ncbi:MAG: flavodoxin-dependent (E)-4-hydroxy-3-methylbut-2-enyl-diphosphate synthase, partial [Elusimicrobia bacterium]|nr:flavodoxin-dependent (E)-4-hydroxy-3-methylbut-2-enyl-diphosphate synthase [Elusimicrobiota bacterium]
IKEGLLRAGCSVPVVADIHFSPPAAMEAAEYAEKVRINPGNFVDNKRFAVKEYTDAEYEAELARIEERFTPLVQKLKRLKRALRLGTNHGSLSDRIMNRYGDSPLGMVESALEYVRICEKNGFHDIILSMKASNPKIMVAAYRLLAARMDELGMDYPFHLGVTEAGGGEDGRIKSAIGIGSLMADGIGDTIRVSLTEDPEFEVPVCRALAKPFQGKAPEKPRPELSALRHCHSFFDYTRRPAAALRVGPFVMGGSQPIRVATAVPANEKAADLMSLLEAQLKKAGEAVPEILCWTLRSKQDVEHLKAVRQKLSRETSRLAFLGRVEGPLDLALEAAPLLDAAAWSGAEMEVFVQALRARGAAWLIEEKTAGETLAKAEIAKRLGVSAVLSLAGTKNVEDLLHEYRTLAAQADNFPIHLRAPRAGNAEDQLLFSSLLIGSLLCDGVGDSVEIAAALTPVKSIELCYNVLQGAGARVTKTEFVSCPSCGRTLFDLQTTTDRIKARTGHLKGVKIAIMGCIVNGPGEMADADFGYVGGAPGKINLYVGKECVQKGIPMDGADEALVSLIKSNGKWVDPS